MKTGLSYAFYKLGRLSLSICLLDVKNRNVKTIFKFYFYFDYFEKKTKSFWKHRFIFNWVIGWKQWSNDKALSIKMIKISGVLSQDWQPYKVGLGWLFALQYLGKNLILRVLRELWCTVEHLKRQRIVTRFCSSNSLLIFLNGFFFFTLTG